MLELNSIAVEPELAEKGVWAEYMGGRFLLARRGPRYQARLVELYNQHLDLVKSDTPAGNEKSLEIFRQAFAETILLDWHGIAENGKPVKYTAAEGLKLLANPRLFELAQFLETYSNNHTNYQIHVEEEVVKDVKSSAAS